MCQALRPASRLARANRRRASASKSPRGSKAFDMANLRLAKANHVAPDRANPSVLTRLDLYVAPMTSRDICNSLSRTSTHDEVALGARSAIFFMGLIEMDDRVLRQPPQSFI
jgi:hypothetical protein